MKLHNSTPLIATGEGGKGKSRLTCTLSLLLAMLAAGCTTTGTGVGTNARGAPRLTFTWTSKGGVTGDMTANLDGTTYSGHFMQATHDVSYDSMGPGPFWGGGMGNATAYTGQVFARLTNPQSGQIRCIFLLARPSSGLSGGAGGRCVAPDGEMIEATLNKS